MLYVNGNKKQSEMTARPDKYPQKKFNDKKCRKCGSLFSPSAPSHLYCNQSCADYSHNENYLKRTYKITMELYVKMLEEQKNRCKICGGDGFLMSENHKLKLVVDHCHSSGAIRGLLCHNCNRGLGLFKDSSEVLNKAIQYLEGATTIRKE